MVFDPLAVITIGVADAVGALLHLAHLVEAGVRDGWFHIAIFRILI